MRREKKEGKPLTREGWHTCRLTNSFHHQIIVKGGTHAASSG